MKRLDYFLGLFLIGFILCIGFCHISFSDLNGYFYFISEEGNFLLYLSLPLFFGFVVTLGIEIYDILKRFHNKS